MAGETKRLGLDRCDYRFSRRQVREHTGWGNTQLKIHMRRLEEMEYLVIHRGGRGQSFLYELLFDGQRVGDGRFVAGLVDVCELGDNYDVEWSGSEADRSGRGRGLVGPKSGGRRGMVGS